MCEIFDNFIWLIKQKSLSLHSLKQNNGQIPEWPNGADCKSAGLRLRWFESIFAHEMKEYQFDTLFLLYPIPAQISITRTLILPLQQVPFGKSQRHHH